LFLNKDSLLNDNLQRIEENRKLISTPATQLSLNNFYVSRGIIYCDEMDQYDSALFYFSKALENNLLQLDSTLYAKCITGVGKVYGMTKRIEEAIYKHKEAIAVQEKIKDTLGLIRSFYQVGVCYYDTYRDTSNAFFRKANKLSLRVNDGEYAAKTYRALGQFYLDMKNIDSALLYLNKALPILELEKEYYDLCNLNLQFALLYSRSGKFNEAIAYAEKAQKVAEKYSYLQLLKNVHDVLTEIYYSKGDCDGAMENLEIKHFIVDSMRSLKVQKNIEELTIKYNVVLKEEKNKQLETDVKAIKLSKTNDRFLFFILLLIALIIGGVVYYMYVSKKRKLIVSDMKIKLSEVRKRELSNRLENAQKIILDKNKLIDRLKEDIEENVDNDEKSKRLLDKLNTKNEWSEFMIEFEMLHANFFSKLNKSVSEPLTKNDIKLSALIRLNLSNKEISDLLYVSDSAVKKGKNRLAKKISLNRGERLANYMNRL
jgi:tetratricopeptide (TPR) repeat protein